MVLKLLVPGPHFECKDLGRWFPKCGQHNITWDSVRDPTNLFYPRPTESETLGMGPWDTGHT